MIRVPHLLGLGPLYFGITHINICRRPRILGPTVIRVPHLLGLGPLYFEITDNNIRRRPRILGTALIRVPHLLGHGPLYFGAILKVHYASVANFKV